MNNNNMPALIRTLIVYAVCVPLAIWIGFMVAGPFDRFTFSYIGILVLIMITPVLLKWHHLVLVVTWNLGMTIFFLPGNPPLWLLTTALSLGISVLHRTINEKARFISAPSLTWPLVFFLAVILITAKLTGGIGLHSLGNETAGGKSYFLLIFGILGYFALTAQPIPPKRAKLYILLFFLGGCASFIGDLAPFIPHSFYFIFAFFPAQWTDLGLLQGYGSGMANYEARYIGIGLTGMAGFFLMLARYGVRGIFVSGRWWRLPVFAAFFVLVFFGGFRSFIILCAGVFVIQAYLERLHQTRVFPFFVLAGIVGIALLIPFANKLPWTFQRALAFTPLKIDPWARRNAEDTMDWRLTIWKETLTEVPKYLLLGKGYALSRADLAVASSEAFQKVNSEDTSEIVQNFHSGPLSVVIPFGVWGCIALLWFWAASLRALYSNYCHGPPEYRIVNAFLLSCFIARILLYLVIFGGLYGDMAYFTSLVGLSISLNGGIRRAAPATAPVLNRRGDAPPNRPRFQPFYTR